MTTSLAVPNTARRWGQPTRLEIHVVNTALHHLHSDFSVPNLRKIAHTHSERNIVSIWLEDIKHTNHFARANGFEIVGVFRVPFSRPHQKHFVRFFPHGSFQSSWWRFGSWMNFQCNFFAGDLNCKGFPSPKHGVDECLSVHDTIGWSVMQVCISCNCSRNHVVSLHTSLGTVPLASASRGGISLVLGLGVDFLSLSADTQQAAKLARSSYFVVLCTASIVDVCTEPRQRCSGCTRRKYAFLAALPNCFCLPLFFVILILQLSDRRIHRTISSDR